MNGLQEALNRADELGGAGRYFDAHEELEISWMKATGEKKVLLQGLIQIAAGLHRLRLDPGKTDGAFYLLDRGTRKLAETEKLLVPETLATLMVALAKIRAEGRAPQTLIFGLRVRNA